LRLNSTLTTGPEKRLSDELSMTLKRVLVADDLTPVLSAVSELLRETFEVVAMVSDGRAALEAVLALEPDLAVLDISMPCMSGIEVARELHRRGCKARIVFLTVHEDTDILETCLSAGGLGYVVKVSMDTDLIPAMKEAIAGRVFVSRFSSQQDTP
jgi:DNA-binding NarL/FixJ family response regulator